MLFVKLSDTKDLNHKTEIKKKVEGQKSFITVSPVRKLFSSTPSSPTLSQ